MSVIWLSLNISSSTGRIGTGHTGLHVLKKALSLVLFSHKFLSCFLTNYGCRCFHFQGKPCSCSLVTHLKKKINVTGISNFNNNTNLFLVPMLGRTWSFFQSQRNINTVVLDTWSWCKMMWSYLPTNTQHFMERMEMKCLGCLNLDLLFRTADFIHLILYCGTILQCDTNTEFCDLCGYSFNKTQNFSAGRALFWTFLVFHLPTLKHKQVSQIWSEHACALNKF